jgi:D-alanyl-D-alanine carboxypeptidase (penicillin-binding protein 5/6)
MLLRCFVIAGLLWAGLLSSVLAQAPQPPEVAARAYLLIDVTANQILASHEIDSPVEPASLTKLMSAYLVFDALRAKKLELQKALPVSERAWKMPGSRMFIDPKMQVPVEDLIKGMVVQSGNDATVALAEGVAGSVEQFVQRMNEQAKALGMKNTVYKNPEGLTEAGHLTTARDLSILAQRLMSDFPEFVSFYAIKKYRYPGTPASNDTNRNVLLFRDPSVDGLKTGHTQAAGYCLVATARRDFPNLGSGTQAGPRRMLAIVLGAASENARAGEAQKLLNWGYTAFEAVKLFDVVRIGRPQPIVIAVPSGSGAKLKTEVVRRDPLVAPFQRGQAMGTLRISIDGQGPVGEVSLVALEAVEEAGILGRAWDAVRLWIK